MSATTDGRPALTNTAYAESLEAALVDALDLVPRVSDDDPMVPALLTWCRTVKLLLARSAKP